MTESPHVPPYMRLLPQDAVAQIARLELLARGMVEGFVAGRHKSPHKGFSVEFAEHRQYVPGDDLRTLDWRVYGRHDRYYVKEYMEETNLRATIVLDASGSMNYRGDAAAQIDGKALSKFEYARYVAAALSYLLIHQQDAVGLVTFDTRMREYLPAKSQASQVRRVLTELHATEPGGETRMAPMLHEVADRIPRRGLVILISDLFDDADELLKALHHFNYCMHEVIVLHVMAEEELTFPFGSFSSFRDLEGAIDTLQVDPKTIRSRYLNRIREFIEKIRKGCGSMKADYAPLSTKENFEDALADFLSRRRQMATLRSTATA